MDNPPTLIVGDVHGHLDRLLALLSQVGIVDAKTEKRVKWNCEVIQIGDIGHFGATGSPTGDRMCLEAAQEWFDYVTWGNHDRALVDRYHKFSGFERPGYAAIQAMNNLIRKQKIRMCFARHGFVICHAGLHLEFDEQFDDFRELVEAVNLASVAEKPSWMVNAISHHRGGKGPVGGVLWMDWNKEPHSKKFKYICGHTSLGEWYSPEWNDDPLGPVKDENGSWNIDIGTKDNGELAGIWLPSEEVVKVKV